MDDSDVTATAELTELRSLTARLVGGSLPSASEVEQALERGFGAVVSLEARLQKTRATRDRQQIKAQIALLREALLEVRDATHTVLPRGFVIGRGPLEPARPIR